jgi:hypothetical protein
MEFSQIFVPIYGNFASNAINSSVQLKYQRSVVLWVQLGAGNTGKASAHQ